MKVLEFEKPIAELDAKIEELRHVSDTGELNISEEISRLKKKSQKLAESIFSSLTPWQVVQLARHPRRPYTLDYVDLVFDEFYELHGDRQFADDPAIVGGIARLDNTPVVIIGHQKGRDTSEKMLRNYGMPKPEGYRKARRLFRLAEKFGHPIITFIDTPGAYPGVDAEERGQSEAIAGNLMLMSSLEVPIICVVIGEGGSGGALAVGVGDRLLMMEYAYYSVISPEGCASILWKDPSEAPHAADALGLTSKRLAEHGLIDIVVKEPLGGAHRDIDAAASELGKLLTSELAELKKKSIADLLAMRRDRLRNIGSFSESA